MHIVFVLSFSCCRLVLVGSCAMAATATASSAGPRYAPEDPTLPKPWRGLVDGKTGYLYFWNPETNVTQYERPTISAHSSKSSSVPISSSVQVQQSSRYGYSPVKEDDRYGRGSNGGSKFDAGVKSGQACALFHFVFRPVT